MKYFQIETKPDPATAVRQMLKKLLEANVVDAVMVAALTPYSALPMPTLIADPELMDQAEPLAPVTAVSAARTASQLTRADTGRRLALVLRPCEMRAFIELVKLHQAGLDNLLLIGLDCPGRLENRDYLEEIAKNPDLAASFCRDEELQSRAARSCRTCVRFTPETADLTLGLLSGDLENRLAVAASTEVGEEAAAALKLASTGDVETARKQAIERLREKREAARIVLFAEMKEKAGDIEGLQKLTGACLNCYNCRQACPVCYCKECVFVTDVFLHEPEVYLRRAARRGAVKLPAETTMFHLTRLAHMSHACVGCGQCESVCPSDIPVAGLFASVAARTQELYDYVPGRDPDEPIPFLAFNEADGDGSEAGPAD